MQISDQLFDPNLTLGNRCPPHNRIILDRQGTLCIESYSSASSGWSGNAVSVIGDAFTRYGSQIANTLQGRTVKEINAFTTNMVYALEKVKQQSSEFESFRGSVCSWFNPVLGALGLGFLAVGVGYDGTLPTLLVCLVAGGILNAIHNAKVIPNCRRRRFQNKVPQVTDQMFDLVYPIVAAKQNIKGISSSRETYQKKICGRAADLVLTDRTWERMHIAPIASLPYSTLFRQFLRLKWKMEKDYYVVTHGQQTAAMPYIKFLTALKAQGEPCSDHFGDDVLRFNSRLSPEHEQCRNVSAYIKKRFPTSSTWLAYETETRELLSVSLNPWDHTPAESALSFWTANSNIVTDIGEPILHSLPAPYNRISPELKSEILSKLKTLAKDCEINVSAYSPGTLYGICIPKGLVDSPETNILYHSEPYGIPQSKPNDLSMMQQPFSDMSPCQGRILTSQLKPENGIRVIGFSEVPSEVISRIQDEVKELALKVIKETCSQEPLRDVQQDNMDHCLSMVDRTLKARAQIQQDRHRSSGNGVEAKQAGEKKERKGQSKPKIDPALRALLGKVKQQVATLEASRAARDANASSCISSSSSTSSSSSGSHTTEG